MKLVNEFIIKDILDYEVMNNVNILQELQNCNLFIILDLLKIGNKCSDEEAEELLCTALFTHDIEDVVDELAVELIGREPDKDGNNVDKEKFQSFSDVLEYFYNEIQTVDTNLGLNDFWNISTRYMYRYADGLKQRYIFKKNQELQSQYSNVAMFMQAFVGKLKECPQLNEDGSMKKHEDKYISDDIKKLLLKEKEARK